MIALRKFLLVGVAFGGLTMALPTLALDTPPDMNAQLEQQEAQKISDAVHAGASEMTQAATETVTKAAAEIATEIPADAVAATAAATEATTTISAPTEQPEQQLQATMPRTEWSYFGATAPALWGALDPAFQLCANGQMQSPINIAAYQPSTELERLQVAYVPAPLYVINTGKGIGVKYEQGSKFMAEGKIYDLQAFKFHSPSEHFVNGAPFPLEMQLLHTDEQGAVAALSVFFKVGETPNPVIQTIWENIPRSAPAENLVEEITIDVNDLLPTDGSYYSYQGSLTIPPCSESVKWYVMKQPVEISAAQLEALQRHYPFNARPLQPLNGRIISGVQHGTQ
ncbi:MAG: carbonic anhydrase [Alphaproteobacteria bacterium]